MLVFEERDSDTVWLLKTAPRRMYPAVAGGPQGFITVSDAPTRFGQVSYSVDAVGSSNTTEAGQPLQLVCNVSLALHGRGMLSKEGITLVVRLRDPQGTRKVSTATVTDALGGATLGKVDGDAETVAVNVAASIVRRARQVRAEGAVSFTLVAVLG